MKSDGVLTESGIYTSGRTSVFIDVFVFCPVAGFMYTNTVEVGHFRQFLGFSGTLPILRLSAGS